MDDELMHYGVPGMRWGHRKARPTGSGARSSAKKKTAKERAEERKAKKNDPKVKAKKALRGSIISATIIKGIAGSWGCGPLTMGLIDTLVDKRVTEKAIANAEVNKDTKPKTNKKG